ncbi:MAG: 16S rRNA processing protein RimM [Firmicutes bacterium]|nr:16S rRNA processing protein RimM [Bacillota bacterium]
MEKILIGKIVNVVGLKGELKVYCYTDKREQFEELEQIWLDEETYAIRNVRYQGNVVILKLEGINDRNAAEACRNKGVYIKESDLPQLPEDSYYVRDLVGLQAMDESGNVLGKVTDVIQSSSQDLYQIRMEDGKNILLPAVKEFVLAIDMEGKTMTVRLPDGLLEL